jgi:hypothetical protein
MERRTILVDRGKSTIEKDKKLGMGKIFPKQRRKRGQEKTE